MQTDRPAFHAPTVALIAIAVYAVAIVLHEFGHALAGALVGGDPTLVSTTDTRGNWDDVSRVGFVILGVSGSLVNWLLALCGLALLRGGRCRTGATRWFLWSLLAVNGFVPAVYMIASPLVNFGDWATILSRFEWQLPLRALTAACGLALTVGWVKLCSRTLVPLIPGSHPAERERDGLRLVRLAWLSGGGVAIAAALLSPLGLGWALPIAAGSTLGTTWPMMIVARRAVVHANTRGPVQPDSIGASRAWMTVGVVAGGVFVFVFGPGLTL